MNSLISWKNSKVNRRTHQELLAEWPRNDLDLNLFQSYGCKIINGRFENLEKLFQGHPDLIIGFNTFLPQGYEINESDIRDSEAAYNLTRMPPQAAINRTNPRPANQRPANPVPDSESGSTQQVQNRVEGVKSPISKSNDSPVPTSPGMNGKRP